MNDTDFQIIEMYYEDGMKESEIAERLGLCPLIVHEVLFEFDQLDNKSMFEE
jgi:DNA-binding transcriptional regulator LsrR (DeoR family)